MSAVAQTLDVARSHINERRGRAVKPRGPYRRAEDVVFLVSIDVQIDGSSYRLRQHAALMPEHLRTKAAIKPPTLAPSPRPRGRPPKNGYPSATA